MIKAKLVAVAVLGASISLGGVSVAFAKGHDQGVADGTPRTDTGQFSRKGAVAGVNTAGIGGGGFVDADGNIVDETCVAAFCGVVGDNGQTYGRTIVSVQRDRGIRRVTPVVNKKNR